MVGYGERAARILRYWRAIELFSPQTAPRVDRGKEVYDLGCDDNAPWTGTGYHYTVYGGLYRLSKVRDHLVDVIGDDDRYHEQMGGGHGALFALTVDGEGNLVENSATLSSCAWAIGRTRSPLLGTKEWLAGFAEEEKQFARALDRLVTPTRSGELYDPELPTATAKLKDASWEGAKKVVETATVVGVTAATVPLLGPAAAIPGAGMGRFVEKLLEGWGRPPPDAGRETPAPGSRDPGITPAKLHEFAEKLAEHLGVTKALEVGGVRVERVQIHQREAGRIGQRAMLNSHFAADLDRVAAAMGLGEAGAALRSYLADQALPADRRVDVQCHPDEVLARVEPKLLPGGTWPTDTRKPLVTSQQFAVDQIMADLGTGAGIFAVNGPPGSGKTTLLRDVIAAVIVERATCLAQLNQPADAFPDEIATIDVDGRYKTTVCGVNPLLSGFEIVVATTTNKAAENVTAEIPSAGAVEGWATEAQEVDYFPDLATHVLKAPAWGVTAACLGSRKNSREFVQRFWWGTKTTRGMQHRLEEAIEAGPDVSWPQAVRRFEAAVAEFTRLRDERQAVADGLARYQQAVERKAATETAVAAAHAAIASHECAMVEATADVDLVNVRFEQAARDYDDHQAHKPGIWVTLSTFFRAGREWYSRHGELRRARDERRTELDGIRAELAAHQAAIRKAEADRDRHRFALTAIEDDIRTARATIESASKRWPGHVPFGDIGSGDELQLAAPWADEEFSQARTRLFLEAMRLHKHFVLAAGRRLKSNLTAFMAHLVGETTLPPDCRLAAWQSLFLVVPVVSTTFASAGRLFDGVGQETLGWLLIDEAGQAAPQEAVGAIWRARRTVVVGDPLQLEPIVSLPRMTQEVLQKVEGVHQQWQPQCRSVQDLADQLARYGTTIQRKWVGAPLRVHRRCDRPIFDISNEIAYDGMMIYGTSERGEYPGQNRWFHVPSSRSNGNWVPDEGRRLVDLHDELTAQGIAPGEIFVISPFRDVMLEARELLRGTAMNVDEQIGTVHTFQGKEADVVILVLGSDPNRPRARHWAAERPNLLNVAVSRARRRLYVIGDRTKWQDLPHFSHLAAALDDR